MKGIEHACRLNGIFELVKQFYLVYKWNQLVAQDLFLGFIKLAYYLGGKLYLLFFEAKQCINQY